MLLGPAPAFDAVGRVGLMDDEEGMGRFKIVFVGAVVKVGRPSAEMRGDQAWLCIGLGKKEKGKKKEGGGL